MRIASGELPGPTLDAAGPALAKMAPGLGANESVPAYCRCCGRAAPRHDSFSTRAPTSTNKPREPRADTEAIVKRKIAQLQDAGVTLVFGSDEGSRPEAGGQTWTAVQVVVVAEGS